MIGAALLLSTFAVAAGAASPAPFSGTWTSIDVDGSAQFLSITNSTKPKVVLVGLDPGAFPAEGQRAVTG